MSHMLLKRLGLKDQPTKEACARGRRAVTVLWLPLLRALCGFVHMGVQLERSPPVALLLTHRPTRTPAERAWVPCVAKLRERCAADRLWRGRVASNGAERAGLAAGRH